VSEIADITRILVPTDFSVGAEAACGLAARLAVRAEADLILFHAVSGVELLEEVGRGRGRSQLKVLDDVRDRLREWFERVVPLELRQPLTVEFKVKVGEPTPVIAWVAERSKADLILMATHGRTGLAHLLVGSVTGAVLRAVPVPVLTLRLGQGERPLAGVQRVLWATDLSPVSEGAWRYAVTLAGVFDAEVVLVHVVRPGEVAASLRHVEQELKRRQQQVEALGVRARWKVVAGPPTEAIVAAAEAEQADLIVMGTRGRTGLPHVLFGSVAEAVIRKAPCPVLAVQIAGRGEARKQGADQASA
jgi:nucleotide-binding universal stress UspA family protein